MCVCVCVCVCEGIVACVWVMCRMGIYDFANNHYYCAEAQLELMYQVRISCLKNDVDVLISLYACPVYIILFLPC